MKQKTETCVELYIPKPEDLWFYQKMMSDPETMSYNANWDVSLVVFLPCPGIEDDIPLLGVHDCPGFLRRDVHIHRLLLLSVSLPTGGQKDRRQRNNQQFLHRFISSTKDISFAVMATHAGRKPQRMALRTDLILHHAAQ